MTTVDALEQAIEEAFGRWRAGGFTEQGGAARVAARAVLAVVQAGGGALTETECEKCKDDASRISTELLSGPCPSCSGSGRQWQIGKLVYHSAYECLDECSPAPMCFVPRSEGDG